MSAPGCWRLQARLLSSSDAGEGGAHCHRTHNSYSSSSSTHTVQSTCGGLAPGCILHVRLRVVAYSTLGTCADYGYRPVIDYSSLTDTHHNMCCRHWEKMRDEWRRPICLSRRPWCQGARGDRTTAPAELPTPGTAPLVPVGRPCPFVHSLQPRG